MVVGPIGYPQANPNIHPLLSGLTAALQNNKQAIENQYLPQTMQANIQEALARAALNNQQAEYYGPQAQADIAYKQEQKRLASSEADLKDIYVDNPLLNLTGAAGQVGAMKYLADHPELMGDQPQGQQGQSLQPGQQAQPNQQQIPGLNTSSSYFNPLANSLQNSLGGNPNNFKSTNPIDMIRNALTSQIMGRQAEADLNIKRAQGYDYVNSPIQYKSQALAQAAGMGYNPQEAQHLYMQGYTASDLARAKGFDPDNPPEPIYPTTPSALTQIQKRQQALAEINSLNPVLTQALAPYSQRVNGYSPKQVIEAISGENQDAQAKFLAARALTPEMSALRLRAMQGNVGIEALKEVTNSSMGNIKAYQSLVTPEIYQRANQYIDQWLEQAVNSANKVGLGGKSSTTNSSSQRQYTDEDLAYTAKKRGLTIEQVKQKLGVK